MMRHFYQSHLSAGQLYKRDNANNWTKTSTTDEQSCICV